MPLLFSESFPRWNICWWKRNLSELFWTLFHADDSASWESISSGESQTGERTICYREKLGKPWNQEDAASGILEKKDTPKLFDALALHPCATSLHHHLNGQRICWSLFRLGGFSISSIGKYKGSRRGALDSGLALRNHISDEEFFFIFFFRQKVSCHFLIYRRHRRFDRTSRFYQCRHHSFFRHCRHQRISNVQRLIS